jgi:hypothetical protein
MGELGRSRPATDEALTTLRIWDRCSLLDILSALGPEALRAFWAMKPVATDAVGSVTFDATGVGGAELERLAETKAEIDGLALSKIAEATCQVIWAAFYARKSDEDAAWLVMRWIDSTFCEVTSADMLILERLRRRFLDVRPSVAPWEDRDWSAPLES